VDTDPTPKSAPAGLREDAFVARQPILDRRLRTVAYELLFRSGLENIFTAEDGDRASMSVMHASFLGGEMRNITGGKQAFVNFTRPLLLDGYPELLPREHVVIELLETIEPDESVVATCRALRRAGYRLALDDFVYRAEYDALLEIVNIVKVDFRESAAEERAAMADRLLPMGIELLAEKVESAQELEEARALGFSYFQGYFFSKPDVITARRSGQGRTSRLELLKEVNSEELDIDAAEEIFRRDPLLAMKLLKYINSAQLGVRNEVRSIRHALSLLGQRNLRKWILVLTLSGMGEDKPGELLRQAIVRAHFCEALAGPMGRPDDGPSLFLLGLFSLLEALADRPLAEILEGMSLSNEVRDALLGSDSPLAEALAVVQAFETGTWDAIAHFAESARVAEGTLPPLYRAALQRGDELLAIQS